MTRCAHRRTEILTTGGYHLAGGDVWDDLRDALVCRDCGREVHRGKKYGPDYYVRNRNHSRRSVAAD